MGGGGGLIGLRDWLYFSYGNRDSRIFCTEYRDMRCQRIRYRYLFSYVSRESKKNCNGNGISKRKPDILLVILPDAINLKCLYSVTQIYQKLFEI